MEIIVCAKKKKERDIFGLNNSYKMLQKQKV